ncbi:unnamed protein product [Ixodes pacificus]
MLDPWNIPMTHQSAVCRDSLAIHWEVQETNEKAPLDESGPGTFQGVLTNLNVANQKPRIIPWRWSQETELISASE